MIDELDYWSPEFSGKSAQMRQAYSDIFMAIHPADERDAMFRFESALFWIAFFARRLFDEAHMYESTSNDVASKDLTQKIQGIADQQFDLDESIGERFDCGASFSVSLNRICNEVIHSKMLNWEWSAPSGREGFYCSSDHNAKSRILFVPISVFQDAANSITRLSPHKSS